jgi:hypothetical protein
MSKLRDLTGVRFGSLVAQWPSGFQGKHTAWLCLCDCGTLKLVIRGNLVNGSTTNCGCSHHLVTTTHGQSYSREYKSWMAMKSRCTNPRLRAWKWYGGRGISVCERWMNSFENFLADMGIRPLGKSLDRYPNRNGNYEPGNCRWATQRQQVANQRKRTCKTLPS